MADAYLKVKDNGAQGLALVREETDTSVSELKTQLIRAENEIDSKASSASLLSEITRAESEEARIEALFSAPTQEAINEWFADNPDAWSTVQDNSISESKLTDSLRVKTIKDYITPQMYGAKGDGVNDDYIAIMACISAAENDNKTIVFPKVPSGYYVSNTIVIESNIDIFMESPIIASGDAIIIGSTAQNLNNRNYILKARGNGTGTGIKLINLMTSNIFVYARDFVNGVICSGDTKGFAYNKIELGFIYNCEYCVTLRGDNESGYCNENLFINGRLGRASTTQINTTGVLIDSNRGYLNNNNIFIKTCVESCDKGFVFNYSRDSKVLFCRSESVAHAFYFSSNCINHIVCVGYGDTTTEDYGVNNFVFDARGLAPVTINNSLFDSGMLSEYAFNNANEFVIGNFICGISSDGTPIKAEFTRYNGYIVPDKTMGVIVSTKDCKKFMVEVTTNNNMAFRLALKLFDNENNEITSGLQSNTIYGKFNYSETGIAGNNPGFVMSSNTAGNVIFTVPDNCEKMFIGIRNTNSPKIMRFKVFGTQKDFIYPSGLKKGLNGAPTCYGANGEVCYSTGLNNIGWKYYDGAWTSF